MAARAALPVEPLAAPAAQAPPGFRALAPGQTAYARRGGAYVRAAPRPDAELISQLFYDTPLPLLGAVDDGGAPAWYQIELWGVLRGWHCLRHSFISNCAAQGIDQRMLDQWVGHTTEEMRRRWQQRMRFVLS